MTIHRDRLFVNTCLIILGLSFVIIACGKKTGEKDFLTLTGLTMGTSYSVKIIYDDKPQEKAIRGDIDKILESINRSMSTYMDDSELSRINQSAADIWIPVSNDLFSVLEAARGIGRRSNGSFDVTVGPLVNLWGFGPAERPIKPPPASRINKLLETTGFERFALDKKTQAIKKSTDSVYIDLSGIAKGYAVDRVSSLILAKYQLADHLVEIGGEVKASGRNQAGNKWQIGVERPDYTKRTIHRIIGLENLAMATSGNYRNYYDLEGKRYSHTIDPQTGYPVDHLLESVSVLHESAMIADAWATALLVMGTEKAKLKAEELTLPVLMVSITMDGKHLEIMNNHFKEHLVATH